jgi:hypothetical protein
MLAGRYDFIDYIGTQRAFAELETAYKALGASEKVKIFTVDDGHGISMPKREVAVTWFRKWLCNDSTKVSEKSISSLTSAELLCTNSGEVSTFFPDEATDVERLKEIASGLSKKRIKANSDLKAQVKSLLNISDDKKPVVAEGVGEIDQKEYVINKVIIRKQQELPLPALVIYPIGTLKNIVVWLSDKGKSKVADSTSLIRGFLNNGSALIIADLAGFGELADPEQLNDPKYYNKEYRNAIAALHIGSSLQSERTKNIIVLMDYITQNEKLKNLPVQLVAKGAAAIPALHSAVIDDRISTLSVHNCISSFEEILYHAENREGYSSVIPGVLKYYDVADLKKALGKRLVSQ